ncbi:MAG TPA: hypothetical protein VF412_19280 [Bdellovibrio sp.]|uniref:hypothetical protein n=1 Tax=Bdellovibrio sp. TaxID=28201 RepID=UPI002F1CB06D
MKKFVLFFYALFVSGSSFSADNDFSYKNQTELRAGDYLFQHQGLKKDPIFENYRSVDLGVNLGVGSDCGRVDFKSTLQATLKNMLDSRYFGDMGKDIIAGSPMLVACYFSPTWCAILKHSQINANFMSQMRLNQCALMDKYVDSRVEDYYEERQDCVHREIEKNGGNIEAAMQTCNSGRTWDMDIANWSGSKYGDKSSSNKLIESSAKWAGLDSEPDGKSLKLVQGLVGDTVLTKGTVSVEYGGRPFALTPRTHLASLEQEVQEKLCSNFMRKVDEVSSINEAVRTANLKEYTGTDDSTLLDRQTLRNLAIMPLRTRGLYCRRLASSIAVARFSEDMNRSLDILSVASQNPNLPDRRKKEIADKRQALKESIDATLDLQRERNSPLNKVVAQINEEGLTISRELSEEKLSRDDAEQSGRSIKSKLFDCSDGVLCN